MAEYGKTNQVLITGRIMYGKNPTDGNFYPVMAASSGYAMDKTVETNLIACTAIAGSTQLKSSAVSLTGIRKVAVFIDHAKCATAVFGTTGTEYRIEVSQKDSGDDTWVAATTWSAASAVCASMASSTAIVAGNTTCTILSGTATTLNQIVFIPSATAGNCEWWRVTAVTGTASFQFLDGAVNAHAATTGMFDGAQRTSINLDVEPYTRLRVVINNQASGTTQAIHSRVALITERQNDT
jgi:hypothetical protein